MSALLTEPSKTYHSQFAGMLAEGQTYVESVFLIRAQITLEQLNKFISLGLSFTGGGNIPRYVKANDYAEFLSSQAYRDYCSGRETPAEG